MKSPYKTDADAWLLSHEAMSEKYYWMGYRFESGRGYVWSVSDGEKELGSGPTPEAARRAAGI